MNLRTSLLFGPACNTLHHEMPCTTGKVSTHPSPLAPALLGLSSLGPHSEGMPHSVKHEITNSVCVSDVEYFIFSLFPVKLPVLSHSHLVARDCQTSL